MVPAAAPDPGSATPLDTLNRGVTDECASALFFPRVTAAATAWVTADAAVLNREAAFAVAELEGRCAAPGGAGTIANRPSTCDVSGGLMPLTTPGASLPIANACSGEPGVYASTAADARARSLTSARTVVTAACTVEVGVTVKKVQFELETATRPAKITHMECRRKQRRQHRGSSLCRHGPKEELLDRRARSWLRSCARMQNKRRAARKAAPSEAVSDVEKQLSHKGWAQRSTYGEDLRRRPIAIPERDALLIGLQARISDAPLTDEGACDLASGDSREKDIYRKREITQPAVHDVRECGEQAKAQAQAHCLVDIERAARMRTRALQQECFLAGLADALTQDPRGAGSAQRGPAPRTPCALRRRPS